MTTSAGSHAARAELDTREGSAQKDDNVLEEIKMRIYWRR